MQSSSAKPLNISPNEHIREAIKHLRAVANHDYSKLYFQAKYTRWKEQSLVAHTAKIALHVLTCSPQVVRPMESPPESVFNGIDDRDCAKQDRGTLDA